MSLYLKYRPQDFSNLVGQNHITTTIKNALKEDRVAHAYLFCGPRGTGKTSAARLLAKALNCLGRGERSEPCNKCDICIQINENKLTDIIEIDAASNRGIDEIRDLREKIKFSPNIAKYKIYIIDEVHMLTKEAFNALLKTLEEPPAHAYFILATTESYKVPETIISRCQRFDFHRMDKSVLIERLKTISEQEETNFEIEALECIADRVNGGMRDAIGLLEQSTENKIITLEHLKSILGLSENQSIIDLFQFLYNSDLSASLKQINNIYMNGFDLTQMTKDFLEFTRMQLLNAVEENDTSKIQRTMMIIEKLQNAKNKIKNSAIPQLTLEIAAIKICLPQINNLPAAVPASAPAAVPAAVPAPVVPAKVDSQTSTTTTLNDNDLTIELRKNWNSILAKMKNPAIRMSFKNAKVSDIKGGALILHYSTNFHMDKTSSTEAKNELETIIKNTYGKKLRIEGVLRKVDLEPVIHESTPDTSSQNNNTPSTIEESPDDAVEVFESW